MDQTLIHVKVKLKVKVKRKSYRLDAAVISVTDKGVMVCGRMGMRLLSQSGYSFPGPSQIRTKVFFQTVILYFKLDDWKFPQLCL